MKREEVKKCRLAIYEPGNDQRSTTVNEIKNLAKLLEEIPLTFGQLSIDIDIPSIDYYPENGSNPWGYPLIRIEDHRGVRTVANSPRRKNLVFVHDIKCLCFIYTDKEGGRYLLEITKKRN